MQVVMLRTLMQDAHGDTDSIYESVRQPVRSVTKTHRLVDGLIPHDTAKLAVIDMGRIAHQ